MLVHIHSRQKIAKILKPAAKLAVKTLLEKEGVFANEVSLSFVTEKEIARLHGLYFDDPTPTDCISFPCDPIGQKEYLVLGDVIVCPEVAKKFAKEHGLPREQELLRYLIHGILHLIGYDDIEEEEYHAMKRLEERYLKLFQEMQIETIAIFADP